MAGWVVHEYRCEYECEYVCEHLGAVGVGVW